VEVAVPVAVARISGEEFFLPLFYVMTEEKKAKIDLAENLFRQRQYHETIILCEEIHKEYPEEESVVLILSWAYYDSGEISQAVKCLNMLLERELKRKVFTGFAFDELVRIYKQNKDFQKLTEICERAVGAQPDDTGLLAELGNACLQSGQVTRACEIYEKLVGMESDNTVFYCHWGEALFAAGRHEESEKAYLKASDIDADQSDRYFFKVAILYQQAGNYREAERLLNKCIAVNSSNPLYYCSQGDTLIGLGRLENAQAAYETAVRCDHSRAGAYYNRLGHSLMKANLFSQAVDAFKSAITYDPVRPYYLNLASAYRGMGLADQADMILSEINKIK
jgi:tetratricopeptide (TPR) repeat protein